MEGLGWSFDLQGHRAGQTITLQLLSEARISLLQALRTRVSNLPTVKKFLQPGSQRKPLEDEKCVESAVKIFS